MEIIYTFYFFAFLKKVIKKLLTFCYWSYEQIYFSLWRRKTDSVLNAAVKPDRQQIFLDELEQIRRDGYAISDNEYDVSASIAKKLKEI